VRQDCRGCSRWGCTQPACWVSILARWVGLGNVRSFGVRFTGQLWPGDLLTLAGSVERVESEPERLAHLVLSATRQTGDVVLKGSATVRVA